MEKELKELYKLFIRIDNVSTKYYIYTVFSDVINNYKNNDEIKTMYNNIVKVCHRIKNDIKLELNEEREKQRDFLEENNDLIERIPDSFCLYDTDFDKKKHSKEGLCRSIEAFLRNMSYEFASFYHEMLTNGRIIILDQYKSVQKTGFSSLDSSDNYICINKLETFEDARALLQEVGKAYYNHCNNITLDDTKDLNLNIKSEIPGLWLEMLFHLYCYKYRKVKNYDDLVSLYGRYAVSILQISKKRMEIEEMYKYIYETDYRELISIRKDKSLVK